MKQTLSLYLLALAVLSFNYSSAQLNVVPHVVDFSAEQTDSSSDYRSVLGVEITDPPPFEVRTMAEWEEIQSLVIAWTSFPAILKQIAYHASLECEVIILASNPNSVENYLLNNQDVPGLANLDNITILQDDFDSIWGRDYGAHTIYKDDVDEMMFVDWIYNRNRPADDAVPVTLAEHFEVPLYSTTEAPYDLMATGGNFMSDGMGTAFSSELILDENSGGSTGWGAQFPNHTTAEVENIVDEFMGIDNYIMMDVLPYDAIHHIDMHMKLLDEETIIMGEYPAGVADGPQIEANLEYILDNYQSSFGTPYDIVRVQMPPEGNSYPNTNGDYRTYTNMVFVNKTVLVPVYEEQYDSPALAVIQEQLPGYNVVGIPCNDIIPFSGAIHCITKAVGVDEPLLIVHDHLDDTEETLIDYQVDATMQHVSDIASATLYYSLEDASWTPVEMNSGTGNIWTGYIPAQPLGTIINYYIEGESTSGKQQVRPIVAPDGFWTFEVVGDATGIDDLSSELLITELYPNPANGITVLKADLQVGQNVLVTLEDMLGRRLEVIYAGMSTGGEQKFFFNAASIPAGAYSIRLQVGDVSQSKRLMVR